MAHTIAALDAEWPHPAMNRLVTDILASSLLSIGLFSRGIRKIADLYPDHKPAPHYEQWLGSSIRFLQEQQRLTSDLTMARPVGTLADLWAEWEATRAAWSTEPGQQAQTAVLEVCLKALPNVLSGKQNADDVVGSRSSLPLAGGLRRGPNAHYFDDVFTNTLTAYVEQQLQADGGRRLRLRGIGAGTGRATDALLTLLQRFRVEEYCFTDVSTASLTHAEQLFQPRFPALTTALFDVSAPVESQSIAANRYDVVIAAQVLHATPNIRESLRNAKAAVKNQGLLLLDEISAWSLFDHVTVGLLEEWWRYEDAAIRLSGSPGLAPEKWRGVLADEGFESIVFPAEDGHTCGRQIVAAVSNGWTRQRLVKQVAPKRDAVMEYGEAQGLDVDATPVRTLAEPTPSSELTVQRSADYIRRIITERLSEALRMDAAIIRNDASFADYGVDSIIGVSFARAISETLQIELEATKLFEYSTVDQLTGYIATNWQAPILAQVGWAEDTPLAPSHPAEAPPVVVESRPGRRFTGVTRFADVRQASDVAGESESGTSGVEPIAIIGMSGRFAASESPDAFWRHLAQGTDLVTPVTRWNPAECVMSAAADHGYCSHGSFVDSIDQFDPAFFGI